MALQKPGRAVWGEPGRVTLCLEPSADGDTPRCLPGQLEGGLAGHQCLTGLQRREGAYNQGRAVLCR